MLLVMDIHTLPTPEVVVRLARLLFPDQQTIDEDTLAQTLVWLQRCKQITGDSAGNATITSAANSRGKWFGDSSENGVSHAEASEEQHSETKTQDEKGTFTLHDAQDEPINVDDLTKSFVSYVKANKLSASSVAKEIKASYLSVLNWLNGKAKPRGESIGRIRAYLDRVTT